MISFIIVNVVTCMIIVIYAIQRGRMVIVVILVDGIKSRCCEVVVAIIVFAVVVGCKFGTVTKLIKKTFGINEIVREWLILIQNSLPLTLRHSYVK